MLKQERSLAGVPEENLTRMTRSRCGTGLTVQARKCKPIGWVQARDLWAGVMEGKFKRQVRVVS